MLSEERIRQAVCWKWAPLHLLQKDNESRLHFELFRVSLHGLPDKKQDSDARGKRWIVQVLDWNREDLKHGLKMYIFSKKKKMIGCSYRFKATKARAILLVFVVPFLYIPT